MSKNFDTQTRTQKQNFFWLDTQNKPKPPKKTRGPDLLKIALTQH